MAARRLVVALLCALGAVAPPAAPAAGPLAHREVLPNGMILMVAERRAIPVVVVSVSVRAGSVLDPPGAGGLANLTAALLTRGTAKRTGPELDRAIEFVGGTLEAEAGRDTVSVSLAVLRKDLDLGLDLLAEVLREPTFPEAELSRKVREIQAVLERAEEDPETVASRALADVLYPGHPYGRPIAGTKETVGQIARDQVVAFHRVHYRPDALTVAVVGDVSREEAQRGIEARLGGWTRPAAPLPATPIASTRPPVVSRTATRDLTQATVMLGGPAVRQDHPDYFPLLVAMQALGGGSSSRLYSRVREEHGLAYSIGGRLSPGRHGSSVIVSLQTRNDAVGETVKLVRDELTRIGRAPLPAAELDVAKSYLIGSFPLRLGTSANVAGFLIGVEENGLGLGYPDVFRERVARVTAADVARVAARYLDPAGLSSVVVSGKSD
jgi:zinc protease